MATSIQAQAGPHARPSRPQAATIRAGALAGIDTMLAQSGVHVATLCEQAGVDPSVLLRPEQRIAWRRYLDLLNRAAAATGNRAFGMHLGYVQCVATLGLVGDIVWSAGTLAEAVSIVSRSMFLHQDHASLSVRFDGGMAAVGYHCGEPSAEAAQQDVELSLAKMLRFARLAVGAPEHSPVAVHFRHRNGDVDAARRLFGSPVLYGQQENAILFPRAWLTVPVRALRSAPGVARPPLDVVEAVRQCIAELMLRGGLSAAAVATELRVSERGLQRRLQARGLAFSSMVEEARQTLARQLLADAQLTMGDISERLGYSEQSAFSRAFRRWNGCSPLSWRIRQGRASAGHAYP